VIIFKKDDFFVNLGVSGVGCRVSGVGCRNLKNNFENQ